MSQELDADPQFRKLDLLLTISADSDPETAAASYADCTIPPRLLSIKEACELEPLLNPEAIAGALTVKHGHIHPQKTTQAYIQALLRAGGETQITQVMKLLSSYRLHVELRIVCTDFIRIEMLQTARLHSP